MMMKNIIAPEPGLQADHFTDRTPIQERRTKPPIQAPYSEASRDHNDYSQDMDHQSNDIPCRKKIDKKTSESNMTHQQVAMRHLELFRQNAQAGEDELREEVRLWQELHFNVCGEPEAVHREQGSPALALRTPISELLRTTKTTGTSHLVGKSSASNYDGTLSRLVPPHLRHP
ncbi:hypothetical protein K490DRAFT_63792 [Saccharata proteae CBS 121410]|uniref:Uncharacterized protein n=1 Tax=Saccharata proteae CBS 121410 TaxID=1314787 RepID=A0A6A5YD83_9PEZI|nr:hypothetical protein K490DRAFT_63792 [Saccharata proteae CBS 121410]